MALMRLAEFNREVVVLDRYRVPYAPAYGWIEWFRCVVLRQDRYPRG